MAGCDGVVNKDGWWRQTSQPAEGWAVVAAPVQSLVNSTSVKAPSSRPSDLILTTKVKQNKAKGLRLFLWHPRTAPV